MTRCLYCYQPLEEAQQDYHPACAKKIFGQYPAPELAYSETSLHALALELLSSQTAVTGVQPKLSLHISKKRGEPRAGRFTLVGLWGGYILKPPSLNYPQLPEVEDLTLHLAAVAGIQTVPHSLIRMASGSLAYITKRVDRTAKGKLAMEDMCQLTGKLTEHKYRGSYEQIAKTIREYSVTPGLDLVNFYELVLFCFLTANADMHLKNFALLERPDIGMILAPAYDLLNTALVNPGDKEEVALTLNGKKNKITRYDFQRAMQAALLDEQQQKTIFTKLLLAESAFIQVIDQSFVSDEFKEQYKNILKERIDRLL